MSLSGKLHTSLSLLFAIPHFVAQALTEEIRIAGLGRLLSLSESTWTRAGAVGRATAAGKLRAAGLWGICAMLVSEKGHIICKSTYCTLIGGVWIKWHKAVQHLWQLFAARYISLWTEQGPTTTKVMTHPLTDTLVPITSKLDRYKGARLTAPEETRAQMAVTIVWAHWYVFLGFVSFVFIN
jgi:hypothetical protein